MKVMVIEMRFLKKEERVAEYYDLSDGENEVEGERFKKDIGAALEIRYD